MLKFQASRRPIWRWRRARPRRATLTRPGNESRQDRRGRRRNTNTRRNLRQSCRLNVSSSARRWTTGTRRTRTTRCNAGREENRWKSSPECFSREQYYKQHFLFKLTFTQRTNDILFKGSALWNASYHWCQNIVTQKRISQSDPPWPDWENFESARPQICLQK